MDKAVLRTPDHCFDNLPDFAFSPRYQMVTDDCYGQLRMHYLDEGSLDAAVVLLLHGEPTWSFLYRKVIPVIVAAGYRVIAPDHIGFGRSDKLPERRDYSYQKYVDWMSEFVKALSLQNIHLVCQDWGGPIGLRVLASMPERFAAVLASNTLLPNCEPSPQGVDGWPGELIQNWVRTTAAAEDLAVGEIVAATSVNPLGDEVKHAYDAPFPDARYKAAVLEFPGLIPIAESMAGVEENRQAWQLLERWHKPFMTAFSDSDPTTKAWETVFQQRVPGAQKIRHREIKKAGHFVQEEQAVEFAASILAMLKA